jgi:hypothetical protein
LAGHIIINSTFKLVAGPDSVFKPDCANNEELPLPLPWGNQEPFYASTSPQMYVIAATTVLSYLLVIMLFITPRTFFIGGHGGGFLSRNGMIGGSFGSSSVIGVGGRPWLQKIATLTVAISLTLASADSFRLASEQYTLGFMDSAALTKEVLNGLEIRIIRVISSTFLWLAQVQTLIRLFPRHKEKVTIKWVGFALIVLDTLFTILNHFVHNPSRVFHPKNIADVIPALNYLFDLSLSLLYAAWVMFYSLSKRRFAFFHPRMKNICLVALLSLVAVLIPFTFFVLDLSQPLLASWGEYIRWVGAAAASVVVWEWVERIEALEREERKDGILGREIFDGDEMLEITPSEEVDWPDSRRRGDSAGDDSTLGTSSGWADRIHLSGRPLRSRGKFASRLPGPNRRKRQKLESSSGSIHHQFIAIPPQVATPVSRADTASVASTIYRVRYHSTPSPASSVSGRTGEDDQGYGADKEASAGRSREDSGRNDGGFASVFSPGIMWLNLFRRRRTSPPQEVATAQAEEGMHLRTACDPAERDADDRRMRWNPRSAATEVMAFLRRERRGPSFDPDDSDTLPVTVIPAPPRREYPLASDVSESATTQTSRSDTLPVRVIPARPRSAQAWSASPLLGAQTAPASPEAPSSQTTRTGNRPRAASAYRPRPTTSTRENVAALAEQTDANDSSGDGQDTSNTDPEHEPVHPVTPTRHESSSGSSSPPGHSRPDGTPGGIG